MDTDRKTYEPATQHADHAPLVARRQLLKSAAVIVSTLSLTAPLGSVAWASSGGRAARESTLEVPDKISHAGFRRMLRKSFFFSNESGSASGQARLIRVKGVSASNESVEQFSLLFRPDRGVELPEGKFSVSNWAGFPDFEVYLQTVPYRRRTLYRADFALMR